MTITRNFKLCLNAGTQNAPYINANQYDEGEEWVFDLYTEGGQKFTPSTGAIIGIKSDGNAILNSGTVNSDGQVVITETQQMTAASGLAVFELLIEGETHGTANFIVNVERRPSDDAEFSDSDLSMLQEAIDAAEVINEILDEGGDPSEIITENVNAWLDNHPEATTTVQDGAITAPKINSTLWDKLLVSEEASGAVASFDDGADDVPVSSLKVALEPVQLGSGDPSPSNIRPIVAANGVNLCPMFSSFTESGITCTVDADGTITLNGTATAAINKTLNVTIPSGTYFFSMNNPQGVGTSAANSIYMYARNTANQWVTNPVAKVPYAIGTGTTETPINVIVLTINSGVTVSDFVIKPQLERGSTASAYQPYQGIMVERCGKNLFDKDNVNLMNAYINGSGTILRSSPDRMVYAHVKPNTDYSVTFTQKALTGSAYADDCQIGFYATKPELNATGTRVYSQARPSATVDYVYTFMGNSGNNSWIAIKIGNAERTDIISTLATLQIEEGSATTYVPYEGNSYPYSLGREVYGGTVDLATGVLTVDRGYVDLSSTDWNNADASGWTQQVLTIDDAMFVPNSQVADIYCDVFVKASANDVYNKVHNNSICINSSKKSQIYCTAIASMSGANIKTYLTGHYLIYPLATQQTYQLTPTQVNTLLGYNNISSSGTVDVIYHADTKLYIDKKIGELS